MNLFKQYFVCCFCLSLNAHIILKMKLKGLSFEVDFPHLLVYMLLLVFDDVILNQASRF